MLELKNVSKSYRSIPAVEDVSFVLRAGEVLGYLGPNGSGKSTTVKMVIGMIQPTKGKVLFAGRNIHDDLASYRAQLGMYRKRRKSTRIFLALSICNSSGDC